LLAGASCFPEAPVQGPPGIAATGWVYQVKKKWKSHGAILFPADLYLSGPNDEDLLAADLVGENIPEMRVTFRPSLLFLFGLARGHLSPTNP
jgi:hypothetical protein